MLMFVVMASLAGIVHRFDAMKTKLHRAQSAGAALQLAKAALLGYAVAYRDHHAGENFGYLPCPDTAGLGVERTPCGSAGRMAIGLLPYKTLGLPDLRDADGNCLWYAVSGSFKNNPKTSPFNWDTQGQITVRDAGGAPLTAPNDGAGGAAAVIVAPGAMLAAPRLGAAGNCGTAAAQAGAYLETSGGVFTQGMVTGSDGNVIANDRVARITPREIFDGVVRRSDFAAFMNNGIGAMRARLGTQTPGTGDGLPANPFDRMTQETEYNFFENWKDQFRYRRCATPGCYGDNAGASHDAILLFGGRHGSGSPRASTARSLTDHFEAALTLARGEAFASCDAEPAFFDNSSAAGRAADLALCLAP